MSAPQRKRQKLPTWLTPELERILELAGACERSLRDWRSGRRRAPPAVRALARIVTSGHLGELGGPWWEGWRLTVSGELIAPWGAAFTPAELQALEYFRAIAELHTLPQVVQMTLPGI